MNAMFWLGVVALIVFTVLILWLITEIKRLRAVLAELLGSLAQASWRLQDFPRALNGKVSVGNSSPKDPVALTISARSARIPMAVGSERLLCFLQNSGPVAQLGARFHGMEEVVGSIPTRSTNPANNLRGIPVLVYPLNTRKRPKIPPSRDSLPML